MRWHYRDPLLVWLLAVAYGCHLLEEWLGKFPEWVAVLGGPPLPRPAFIVINAIAVIAIVAAARAATRHERHGWMVIAIATILLINAVLHMLGSVVTGTYSPGLVTSVVLYMPLGQLAMLRALHQAERALIVRGVVAGVAIHALVIVVALSAARLAVLTSPSSTLLTSSTRR